MSSSLNSTLSTALEPRELPVPAFIAAIPMGLTYFMVAFSIVAMMIVGPILWWQSEKIREKQEYSPSRRDVRDAWQEELSEFSEEDLQQVQDSLRNGTELPCPVGWQGDAFVLMAQADPHCLIKNWSPGVDEHIATVEYGDTMAMAAVDDQGQQRTLSGRVSRALRNAIGDTTPETHWLSEEASLHLGAPLGSHVSLWNASVIDIKHSLMTALATLEQ